MEAEDRASSLTALAPSPPLRHHHLHGGASKACTSLAKIIAVISTAPPLPSPDIEQKARGGGFRAFGAKSDGRGIGIDLNLRLGPSLGTGSRSEEKGDSDAYIGVAKEVLSPVESSVVEEEAEKVETAEDSISPAESAADDALTAEKSSEGECDLLDVPTNAMKGKGEEEPRGGGETAAEEKKMGNGSEGYLGLLLEAVRQVSGGFFDDNTGEAAVAEEAEAVEPPALAADAEELEKTRTAPSARSRRRRICWTPPFDLYEDSGPVVRSKRGRSQALPSRYRDSVLEPWAKLPTVHRPERPGRTRTSR